MLTVWGREDSSNVRKVTWCLGELGLAFDRIDVGGKFGGNDDPDYRALNPNGLVPTLKDGETILWESNVIVRYLCMKHSLGLLCPKDLAVRAKAEMWMDWQQNYLIPSVNFIFRQVKRKPEAEWDVPAIDAAKKQAVDYMKILDAHLSKTPYVAGDDFTMGDIPVGFYTNRWTHVDDNRPSLNHLEAWHERLKSRPSYKQYVTDLGA